MQPIVCADITWLSLHHLVAAEAQGIVQENVDTLAAANAVRVLYL